MSIFIHYFSASFPITADMNGNRGILHSIDVHDDLEWLINKRRSLSREMNVSVQ